MKGCPVSQQVWHAKEPSLLNGHECRAQVKIYCPSPATVTSPYERKILEWDEKNPNKHTLVYSNAILYCSSRYIRGFFFIISPNKSNTYICLQKLSKHCLERDYRKSCYAYFNLADIDNCHLFVIYGITRVSYISIFPCSLTCTCFKHLLLNLSTFNHTNVLTFQCHLI